MGVRTSVKTRYGHSGFLGGTQLTFKSGLGTSLLNTESAGRKEINNRFSMSAKPNDLPLNQIVCGDNCEVMATFPDESIDLTVTSPPYDDLRQYGGHSWNFKEVANSLLRVTKLGGVVVWVVGDKTENGSETGTSFRQALWFKKIGFNLHDTMIYFRNGMRFPETNRYYPAWEYMFVFSKGVPKTVNLIADRKTTFGGTKHKAGMERHPDGRVSKPNRTHVTSEFAVRYNMWTIDAGYGKSAKDKVAFEHPAIFPEALARDHIRSWSNEGDVVLDPFSGSGTTAKMARELGRHYIGIEVHKEYCEISEQRLKAQEGKFGFQFLKHFGQIS